MRRFLKILLVLVVLLVAAIGVFIAFLPTDRIAQLAVDQVKTATGRDLTLAGGVSPSFYPVLGVETGAVTLSNAEWGESPNMVSTTSAKIGVELMPLISGTIKITEIRLIDPVIALEVNEEGTANWVFEGAAPTDPAANDTATTQDGEGFLKEISLGETVIENGAVSFTNRATGQSIAISAINASLALPALDQDMTIKGDALWNGEQTTLDLTVSTPRSLMDGGETGLKLSAGAAPLTASFDGALMPPNGNAMPEVAGAFELTAADPAKAAAWATGAPAPDALLGLSDVALGGEIAMDQTALIAKLNGGVTRDGRRATVNVTANSGGDWAVSRAFDIVASAALEGLADLRFEGAVQAPDGASPSGSGTFDVSAPDLPALAAFAGAALPDMGPDALRSFAASGSISLPNTTSVEVDLASLALDAITASGTVSVDLSGTPNITANLTAGDLDLRPYVGDSSGEAAPAGEPGWSKAPIDLSGLGSINGDFKIRAASVRAPQISLGKSDIHARLSGGALTLNVQELGFYGGGVKGDIKVDGRSGNALSANISASTVRLLPMLKDIAGLDMVEGLGAVNADIRGSGASLHDIMNSLDGRGGMKLSNGALVGYNLAEMVRNVQGAFGGGGGEDARTDFSEISATFDIANGVMTNADFSFLGPLLRVTGEGTIDLGGQAVNFRLVPKAVTSLTGQGGSFDDKGIAFPLIIKGPWSAPSIRPDLKAGIDNLLKDPEGAVNAAKDLLKGAKEGGGVKGAIDALKGGNDTGSGLGGLLTGGGEDKPEDAVKGVLKGLFGSD